MASSARALRAAQFMQRCRQPYHPLFHQQATTSFSTSSSNKAAPSTIDTSHLHPSNFDKPLRNPNSAFDPNPGLPPHPEPPFIRASWHYPSARSTTVADVAVPKITAWMWLKMRFGWTPPPPKSTPAPFNAINNPYKARTQWPPDFAKLHPKQQFHYEKTYRRRAKLKWARPNWSRWTRLVQHTLIAFTVIYFVFICDPAHGQGTPFDGFRVWFYSKIANLGSLPAEVRSEAEVLEQGAKERIVHKQPTPAR